MAGSPGGEVTLVPRGSVVVLEFFATWCAACDPQMAPLRAIGEEFQRDSVVLRSVTAERNEQAVRDYWQRYDPTWPVCLDDELTAHERFTVEGLPTVVVIDPTGETVFRREGVVWERTLRRQISKARSRSQTGT